MLCRVVAAAVVAVDGCVRWDRGGGGVDGFPGGARGRAGRFFIRALRSEYK